VAGNSFLTRLFYKSEYLRENAFLVDLDSHSIRQYIVAERGMAEKIEEVLLDYQICRIFIPATHLIPVHLLELLLVIILVKVDKRFKTIDNFATHQLQPFNID